MWLQTLFLNKLFVLINMYKLFVLINMYKLFVLINMYSYRAIMNLFQHVFFHLIRWRTHFLLVNQTNIFIYWEKRKK